MTNLMYNFLKIIILYVESALVLNLILQYLAMFKTPGYELSQTKQRLFGNYLHRTYTLIIYIIITIYTVFIHTLYNTILPHTYMYINTLYNT